MQPASFSLHYQSLPFRYRPTLLPLQRTYPCEASPKSVDRMSEAFERQAASISQILATTIYDRSLFENTLPAVCELVHKIAGNVTLFIKKNARFIARLHLTRNLEHSLFFVRDDHSTTIYVSLKKKLRNPPRNAEDGQYLRVHEAVRLVFNRCNECTLVSNVVKMSTIYDSLHHNQWYEAVKRRVAIMQALKDCPYVPINFHYFQYDWCTAFKVAIFQERALYDLHQMYEENVLLATPLRTKLAFCRQLIEALKYMHSKGIVHRDLKLENILAFQNGKNIELKISDFGFARFDTDPNSQSACGTYMWAAPEMIRRFHDQEAKIGTYSDMWSLGQIFQVILTNEPTPIFVCLTKICEETDKFSEIKTQLAAMQLPLARHMSKDSQIEARSLHTLANGCTDQLETEKIACQPTIERRISDAVYCLHTLSLHDEEPIQKAESMSEFSSPRESVNLPERVSVQMPKQSLPELLFHDLVARIESLVFLKTTYAELLDQLPLRKFNIMNLDDLKNSMIQKSPYRRITAQVALDEIDRLEKQESPRNPNSHAIVRRRHNPPATKKDPTF